MNKYQETLETLHTLYEVSCLAEKPDAAFQVMIKAQLLSESIEVIEELILLTETFSDAVEITKGETKPKIKVDIEKFLSAKAAYQAMTGNQNVL